MRLVSYSVHAGIAASLGMKMLIEEVLNVQLFTDFHLDLLAC